MILFATGYIKNHSWVKKGLFLLILPLLVIATAFILFHKDDFIVFPSKKILMSTYSDMNTYKEGKTLLPQYQLSDSCIRVRFTIQEGYQYPYAGIIFQVNSDNKKIDISDYDILKINVKTHKSKSLKLIFHLSYSYSDRKGTIYPYRIIEYEIPSDGEYYEVPLKKFLTPHWWYRRNKVNEKEAGQLNFKETVAFLIQNGSHTPTGEEELLTLKSVALSQDSSPFWQMVFIFLLIYYFVFLFLNRKKTDNPVIVPYKELEITGNTNEEKLFFYLANHYYDPELSIEKLNRELGIPVTKIPILIKNKSGMAFKQYLNSIRIEEAKRLLKDTDEQITQISYSVGYNTVTHFNKIFKELENMSPKEYRAKK